MEGLKVALSPCMSNSVSVFLSRQLPPIPSLFLPGALITFPSLFSERAAALSRGQGQGAGSWRTYSGGVRATMGNRQREKPGPGQESVWDYPRPPRLEPVPEKIKIVFNGKTIADTTSGYRVLETSHPPVYYIPQSDVNLEYVKRASGSSFCEWKGNASYWSVSVDGRTAEKVGWSYEDPTSTFRPIKSYIAFYAGPMDACYVGDEKAEPQPGGFYGGWVTSKVVGPFKGGAGSWGW